MSLRPLALALPIASQLLIWALVSLHRERLGLRRLSGRGTLIVAFTLGQVAVVAISELLSAGHHLTPASAAAAWALVAAGLAIVLWRTGGVTTADRWRRDGGPSRAWQAVTVSPVRWLGVLALLAVGAVLVHTAWTYLPNNSDSLAYHLARVAHWVQERSVGPFATHYPWQVQAAPLHEYDMLQLHLLTGTDRFDGFPQLAAFVVCVLGAGEVVRLLGGDGDVQILAAVIAACTPSLLLEATSTQNNLFAAGMGMGAVVLALAWEPHQRAAVPALLLGLALGLTVMTKGTAVPLLGPVIAALALRVAVVEGRDVSWSSVAKRAATAGAVAGIGAALVIGPFWARNVDVFGNVNGGADQTLNDHVSPRAALANGARNLALQFHVGDGEAGLDTETSALVLPLLRRAFDATGQPTTDGHLDYPFLHEAFERRDYRDFQRNEDYGASPWLTLLLAICLPVLWFRAARGDRSTWTAAVLGLGGLVGLLVFSALTKWTPYGARYLLPLMVLGPPLAAVVLHAVHRYVLRAVAVLLLVAGIPSLVDSWARPLFDRPVASNDIDPYLVARPQGDVLPPQAEDYVIVRDGIVASGCDRVGIGNWLFFEYLLWVGLDNAGWTGEIQHTGRFTNASGELADPGFEPCAVVHDSWWTKDTPPPAGMVARSAGKLTLFLTPEAAARAGWDVNPAS